MKGDSSGIGKLDNEIGLWWRYLHLNNGFMKESFEKTTGQIFEDINNAPDSIPLDPWKWPLCNDKNSNCSLMNDGGFRYIKKVLAPQRTAVNLTSDKLNYETLKKERKCRYK